MSTILAGQEIPANGLAYERSSTRGEPLHGAAVTAMLAGWLTFKWKNLAQSRNSRLQEISIVSFLQVIGEHSTGI